MPAIICAHCAQLNPASARSCSGCGAALGVGAVTAPFDGTPPRAQMITVRDLTLLVHYAQSLPTGDPLRAEISMKLERCEIVLSADIPPDMVTLNSRAVFRVEGQEAETRLLVDPRAHMTPGLTLPVTTPLGVCLLGATAGDRVAALRRDGGREIVEIVRVAYRPEVSRRESPAPLRFGAPAHPDNGGSDDPGPDAA